jgi:RNA polymerase sigma factor (sigma-70 family)
MKTLPFGLMYNEEELIQGCLQEDPRKQERLYQLFASRMLAVCLRYTRSRMEAEDILQEGFIKVFLNIGEFRRECPLEQWIKRVMVNTALKHIRQGSLIIISQELPQLEVQAVEEEPIFLSEFTLNDLFTLVHSLPTGYQTVFNLYAIEGYSHKEIAELLGISEGTSKSQYARARQQLQEMVRRQQHVPNLRVS